VTDLDGQSGNPDRLASEGIAALLPSLARLMPEIGARYWKAYYAARASNWPMAAWQLDEMRKLLRLGEITGRSTRTTSKSGSSMTLSR